MSEAQLLTRNRYQITVYRRWRAANGIDLVYFRLSIAGAPAPSFTLPVAIVEDLTRDLGMRPVFSPAPDRSGRQESGERSPEANEWESTPIGATTYRGEIP